MAERGGGCCPPMDLMRSEAMQLVQLIIPIESAHLAVSYLGDLGLVQFKDGCDFRHFGTMNLVIGENFIAYCFTMKDEKKKICPYNET